MSRKDLRCIGVYQFWKPVAAESYLAVLIACDLQKPDKSKVSGGHEAWTEGIPSIYGGFKGHKHEPTFFVVWEMDSGEG